VLAMFGFRKAGVCQDFDWWQQQAPVVSQLELRSRPSTAAVPTSIPREQTHSFTGANQVEQHHAFVRKLRTAEAKMVGTS
jgi:hypothetical protein